MKTRRKIVIPDDDPVGKIRALADQRQAGELTDEEYQRQYQDVNAQHGERCACKRGQIVYVHPVTGARLCGDCALEALGVTLC